MSKELKKAIVPVIVCVIFSGLTVFLLSPSSPAGRFIRVDLSYLMGPIIAFLVIRLGRRLAIIFIPRLAGRLLACSLSGASAAIFLSTFLNWICRVPQIEAQVSSIISSIIGYSIILIVGITIYMLAKILDEEESTRWAGPVTRAAGLLAIGLSIYAALNAFAEIWEFAPSVGLVVLAGFIASAISSLAEYGEMAKNRYIADISQLISKSGFWMFTLGALMFSYVALIRPSITDSFAYTPLRVASLLLWTRFWFQIKAYHGALASL